MSSAALASATSVPNGANAALTRLGLVLMAAVGLALDAESLHRFLLAVSLTPQLLFSEEAHGGIQVTGYTGLAFLLLFLAAQRSLGRWALRGAFCAGVLLIVLPNLIKSLETPHYGVDSIAYTRYATRLLMEGAHPYRDFDAAAALERYPVMDTAVTYNTDGSLHNVLNYPAGAFLSLVPFYLLGDLDPRWLYGLSFLVLTGLLVQRAPDSIRPLVLGLLVFHQFYYVWAVPGGLGDPLWMGLLVLAWLARDRPLVGGAILGWALAVKQPAWFFYPYYVVAQYRERGPKAAAQAGGYALAVFAVANLPFLVTDPAAWLEGVTAPMTQPLPAIGVGLARWGALTFPQVPKLAYSLMEGGAFLAGLAAYWRWGKIAPALVFALPWIPLWFSWRCLSVYFYLMPLAILLQLMERQRQRSSAPDGASGLPPLLLPLSLIFIAITVLALVAPYEAYLLWEEMINRGLSEAARQRIAFLTLLLSAFSLVLMIVAAAAPELSKRTRLFSFFAAGLMVVFLTLAAFQSFRTYQVDTALATHYAAQLALQGQNPYQEWDLSAAAERFHVPKALLKGAPSEDAYSYPAGSFLSPMPLLALGLPDVRLFYGAAQVLLSLLAFARTPAALKPITFAVALCAISLGFLFVGEGYNDVFLGVLLLLTWLWRDRPLLGGGMLGWALAVKQTAWFFLPFYLVMLCTRRGRAAALRGGALAVGVFLLANVPFLVSSPGEWAQSVFGPVFTPLTGIAQAPSLAEHPILAGAGLLLVAYGYWRWGRRQPLVGFALPWVPLWFAWPSLFSIFHVLPLVLLAAAQWDEESPALSVSPSAATQTALQSPPSSQ